MSVAIRAAHDTGIVIVTSAGNFYNQDACRYAPPHLPETIAVGSTTQNDVVAPFSNVGRCVDVYAPGVAIRGADAKAFRLQPNRTPKTVAYSGTSQSCPIVVGAG